MKLQPLVLGAALAMALPQIALSCAQLSQHVWMCNRGTPWETAQWDQYGDGATLILDEVAFNFSEEWPGHKIGQTTASLEELYATYLAWIEADHNEPVEVLEKDVLETPRGRALRSLQRDQIEDSRTTSALMLAQVGDARIMLYLDAPDTMAVEDMRVMSGEVLDMLYDSCADAVSCADDYQPPEAALNE